MPPVVRWLQSVFLLVLSSPVDAHMATQITVLPHVGGGAAAMIETCAACTSAGFGWSTIERRCGQFAKTKSCGLGPEYVATNFLKMPKRALLQRKGADVSPTYELPHWKCDDAHTANALPCSSTPTAPPTSPPPVAARLHAYASPIVFRSGPGPTPVPSVTPSVPGKVVVDVHDTVGSDALLVVESAGRVTIGAGATHGSNASSSSVDEARCVLEGNVSQSETCLARRAV